MYRKTMRAALEEARQYKDPKTEYMVSKDGKTIVIDKKDWPTYKAKGWELAEEVKPDYNNIIDLLEEYIELKEFTSSQIAVLKKEYGPLKGKLLSPEQNKKLRQMLGRFDNARLKQLADTDIPMLASAAQSELVIKRGFKWSDFKKPLDMDYNPEKIDELLSKIKINDVWGVGRQLTKFYIKNGINTAYDLKKMHNGWIKKNTNVFGSRTAMELKGIPCISLEIYQEKRKNCCVSRSFGRKVTKLEELKESITTHCLNAAEKIRADNQTTKRITVFIRTSPFQKDKNYYANSKDIDLPIKTDDSIELVKQALIALRSIYIAGYKYQKTGIIFSKLNDINIYKKNLFSSINNEEKRKKLMNILLKEKVQVLDITNGNRIETYIIPGERGSGEVCINGAAAHLIKKGDLVIIVAYCQLSEIEVYTHKPTIVHVNAQNRVVSTSIEEAVMI